MSYIQVNYAVLAEASDRLAAISRTVNERLDALRAALASASWEGADREAYERLHQQWEAAARDLNETLAALSAALVTASDNYAATEQASQSHFRS